MNVAELARQLKIHPKEMLDILPRYGFDIGKKAIKVDNKVASQIMARWRFIKKDIDEKRRLETEEMKQKEKEMRQERGIKIAVEDKITVKDLAQKFEIPVTNLISELMKNGVLANQNQFIDFDTASIIAEELGFSVQKSDKLDTAKDSAHSEALEEILSKGIDMKKRPPVVVVMGHVDHGKTRLLDSIRKTNIIDTEAGGITQHIGAYQTVWKDPKTKEERNLTFIDTPGHEAFTVMRSRGAKVADIAIIVVAADDGVKPQTKEVIQIVKAAKLPFVVAINKIDKEGADVQKTKTDLSQHGILAEEWGGDATMVEISAKQGLNIDKLLDVILLVADMNEKEITADYNIPAAGTIIESHVDKGMGPVATLLVQAGILKKNDPLVVNGEIYGKVRAMKNYKGELIEEAAPSVPVQIIGFKVAPQVGDILDVASAEYADKIDVKAKKTQQTGAEQFGMMKAGSEEEGDVKKKFVNLLIKADVLGSLEAIIGSLENIIHEEVTVQIIGKGLGNINEDDVHKAIASKSKVVGFNVKATPIAEESMRENGIEFLQFNIIYDLIDYVKVQMEKMLDQEKIIKELGNAKVLAVFRTDKGAMTVGARIEYGKAVQNALARVKRSGQIIGKGKISECQTGKQKTKEVPSGTECGLRFEGKTRIEEGDVVEFYTEESKVRKLGL